MEGIPNEDQLAEAHNYAIKKLCINVGNEYGQNLTQWNESDKTCRFTQRGCDSTISGNPFSKPWFDNAGNSVDYSPRTPNFGDLWKYAPPKDMVWKKLKNEEMGCGISNSLFKRYCLIPEVRSYKSQAGVTNVKPFDYIVEDGEEKCRITKEYCDDKGISYNYSHKECVIPVSQKIGEFFSGTTLVRDARSGRTSDRRLKKNITVYKSDFFDGLNIYTFEWSETAQLLYNKPNGFTDVGFLADEFKPSEKYYDEYGYLTIDTSADSNRMKIVNLFYKIKDIYYNNNVI